MKPRRIQRRRTKGWRMPEGAVYVGRPTRWGNPFVVSQGFAAERAVALFSYTAHGIWVPHACLDEVDSAQAYRAHWAWLERLGGHPVELARAELRGRDLACWCPLDAPCHADVLLEIANQ